MIYKPDHYNSLSPYLIVDEAQKLVERRFDHENGKIAHIELKLDDSVIMISDSTENYRANKSMLHVYVPDVFKTFDKAIEYGCKIIEKPVKRQEDPDIRGAFYDFAGNYWAVSTQKI